jgi:acetylornithine/succinyldiaminopimelate/putrescine aminotransferase
MENLSSLNESNVFGYEMIVTEAKNASVHLKNSNGEIHSYLDFMSAYGSVNFGHCNDLIQPFYNYSSDIVACFYPHEAKKFSHWLCNRLNLPTHKVLFQVGGSFAVSAALSIAQRIRAGKVIAINGSFHGLGLDSLSITTAQKEMSLHKSSHQGVLENNVIFINQGDIPKQWDNISCIIYEPIQGANGYVPLDTEWLNELNKTAKKHGVITIADEIQCGYFRHGSLSPARSMGLEPEILLYSKSMTNGLYPMSAVVYPKEFEEKINMPIALAHTFQSSALGCFAAYQTAVYIDNNPVETQIIKLEKYFATASEKLLNSGVQDLHLTGPSISFALYEDKAKKLVKQCFEEKLMVFTGGVSGQRVRIAPPITIQEEDLVTGLNLITELVKKLN